MNRLIASLDREFTLIHRRSCELVDQMPPALLYQKVSASNSASTHSFGEEILRSAAAVEQTFGGITTNLWDDPIEWTLPETLATPEKLREYLEEVEATRKRGFDLFQSDDNLSKEIMAPAGETQLLPLLLDTLERAAHHQGLAQAMATLLTGAEAN